MTQTADLGTCSVVVIGLATKGCVEAEISMKENYIRMTGLISEYDNMGEASLQNRKSYLGSCIFRINLSDFIIIIHFAKRYPHSHSTYKNVFKDDEFYCNMPDLFHVAKAKVGSRSSNFKLNMILNRTDEKIIV